MDSPSGGGSGGPVGRRLFWAGPAAPSVGAGVLAQSRRSRGAPPAFPASAYGRWLPLLQPLFSIPHWGARRRAGRKPVSRRCQVALGTHRGALREDHGATGRARRPTRRRQVPSLPGDMRGSPRDPLGLAMLRTGSTSQPRGCLPRPSRRGATFTALPQPTPRSPATLSFKAPTRSVRRHSILRSALPPQRLSSMHGAPACVGYGASCA